MVPKPVKAVVLLFPIEAEGDKKRKLEDEGIAKEGQPKIDPTIFWVKQTVCFGFSSRADFHGSKNLYGLAC